MSDCELSFQCLRPLHAYGVRISCFRAEETWNGLEVILVTILEICLVGGGTSDIRIAKEPIQRARADKL